MRFSGGGWRLQVGRGWTARTEQMPAPWSVLGGQAGHEEQLRTKHLPSLEPPGGPEQVWPNVGPLSTFCTDSGLVLSYPTGPQRGRSRPCQGKGGNYKGAPRGPPTPQLGLTGVHFSLLTYICILSLRVPRRWCVKIPHDCQNAKSKISEHFFSIDAHHMPWSLLHTPDW